MATIEHATEIRPFHFEISEEQLDDLHRRITATRWPSKELVEDRSQGVQLATMQELVRYWGTEYDFQRLEARLNALPQFITEIDGLDIHFIHVKSPHENALPIIITHGWPGSVAEFSQACLIPRNCVHHQAAFAELLHDRSPHAGGRACHQGGPVVAVAHTHSFFGVFRMFTSM